MPLGDAASQWRGARLQRVSFMALPVMLSLPELTEPQREAVREACGFACVRCGVTIYRYLRLPDSPQATLLCPTCHALVEEGRLTTAQVQGLPIRWSAIGTLPGTGCHFLRSCRL